VTRPTAATDNFSHSVKLSTKF